MNQKIKGVDAITESHQKPQDENLPHQCAGAVRTAILEKRIEELEKCYAQTLDNYVLICKRLRKMERRWALLHDASHPGRAGE